MESDTPLTGRLGMHDVRRIGFGAMQLPGPDVFGPPKDRAAALDVLRRAVELGVDHIDTAQFYGPDVANELIREALHPYPADLVLVSKVGARRDATGGWIPAGRPEDLRAGVEENLRSLGVERLGAVNLRLTDDHPGPAPGDTVSLEDQLGAMVELRDAGLIEGIGLSNVSVAQLEQGRALTEIVCVQNPLNLTNRASMPVLEACTGGGIAFVPFFPLGSGFAGMNQVLADPTIGAIGRRLGASPSQVALAWLLTLGAQVLLIPGTSSRAHLEENMASGDVELDQEALSALRDLSPAEPQRADS